MKAPRVKGAPISFECRLHKIVPVGDIGDQVIIGEVVLFHIRDDLYLERGRIGTAAIRSVGRLAAGCTLVENVFTTPLEDSVVARATSACIGSTVSWLARAMTLQPSSVRRTSK